MPAEEAAVAHRLVAEVLRASLSFRAGFYDIQLLRGLEALANPFPGSGDGF